MIRAIKLQSLGSPCLLSILHCKSGTEVIREKIIPGKLGQGQDSKSDRWGVKLYVKLKAMLWYLLQGSFDIFSISFIFFIVGHGVDVFRLWVSVTSWLWNCWIFCDRKAEFYMTVIAMNENNFRATDMLSHLNSIDSLISHFPRLQKISCCAIRVFLHNKLSVDTLNLMTKIVVKGFNARISSVEGQCANHYTIKSSVIAINFKWIIVFASLL